MFERFEKVKMRIRRMFPETHAKYVEFRISLKNRQYRPLVEETKLKYKKTLERIRAKYAAKQPIRVLFLISEASKWKCQSIYDEMDASAEFEPMIAISRMDFENGAPIEDVAARFAQAHGFFEKRKMKLAEAYSLADDCPVDLAKFKPDIVFYPTYWFPVEAESQQPSAIADYALALYIPYFVVCHDAAPIDSMRLTHLLSYRYFTTNKEWCAYFEKKGRHSPYAGEFIGLGHPMLDCYADVQPVFSRDDYVIFAPHFSIFNLGERYSTFHWSGRRILEYAKRHPEIHWCFKPHPHLKRTLKQAAGWSQEEIDSYYGEWEKLGVACYDGAYPELFMHSRALITDCSSFLMEYSAVNRPLIHLIRNDSLYSVAQPCKRLFNTFYKVHDETELAQTLKAVIEGFADSHADERKEAIMELNLWHVRCADRIVDYLREMIKGETGKNA